MTSNPPEHRFFHHVRSVFGILIIIFVCPNFTWVLSLTSSSQVTSKPRSLIFTSISVYQVLGNCKWSKFNLLGFLALISTLSSVYQLHVGDVRFIYWMFVPFIHLLKISTRLNSRQSITRASENTEISFRLPVFMPSNRNGPNGMKVRFGLSVLFNPFFTFVIPHSLVASPRSRAMLNLSQPHKCMITTSHKFSNNESVWLCLLWLFGMIFWDLYLFSWTVMSPPERIQIYQISYSIPTHTLWIRS